MLYEFPSITDALQLATDSADKQHSARKITGSHPCSAVRMFVEVGAEVLLFPVHNSLLQQ